MGSDSLTDDFTAFVKEAEQRMRYALVADYGPERGLEATADAFAYAWEHWDRIRGMDNPAGYVYRSGQRYAGRVRLQASAFPDPAAINLPWTEPALPEALAGLTAKQRTAVVLIRAYGYTHREVGELLDVSVSSVQKHVDRGVSKLRSALGVTTDA